MPYQCTSLIDTQIVGYNVADCLALGQFDAALAKEASRSASMPQTELDSEVITIIAALDRRQIAVSKASEAVAKGNKKLALEAIGVTVDLTVETCVLTRNPVCIGSAYGAKILYETAEFGIQLYDARTPQEKAEAVFAFGKGRVALFKGVIGAVAPKTPAQSAARAMSAAVRAARTLSSATSTVAQAKSDLEAAVGELEKMKTLFDPVLVNADSYRKYRASAFEARRFLLQLLNAGFAGQGCRVDTIPLPIS